MIRVTLCFECACGKAVEKTVATELICHDEINGDHVVQTSDMTMAKLWMDEQGTKWVLLRHTEPMQPPSEDWGKTPIADAAVSADYPESSWPYHAPHVKPDPRCHLCNPHGWQDQPPVATGNPGSKQPPVITQTPEQMLKAEGESPVHTENLGGESPSPGKSQGDMLKAEEDSGCDDTCDKERHRPYQADLEPEEPPKQLDESV